MPHAFRRFGDEGEDLAVSYFAERGFTVVMRNWSCTLGEIDLVLAKDGVTHFVEVKTRRSLEFGYPEESITQNKLRKLARTIEWYLREVRDPPSAYQVDALAITIPSNQEPQFYYVEHIL